MVPTFYIKATVGFSLALNILLRIVLFMANHSGMSVQAGVGLCKIFYEKLHTTVLDEIETQTNRTMRTQWPHCHHNEPWV